MTAFTKGPPTREANTAAKEAEVGNGAALTRKETSGARKQKDRNEMDAAHVQNERRQADADSGKCVRLCSKCSHHPTRQATIAHMFQETKLQSLTDYSDEKE